VEKQRSHVQKLVKKILSAIGFSFFQELSAPGQNVWVMSIESGFRLIDFLLEQLTHIALTDKLCKSLYTHLLVCLFNIIEGAGSQILAQDHALGDSIMFIALKLGWPWSL